MFRYDLVPIKFYPYTSTVVNRIYQHTFTSNKDDEIASFRRWLINRFKEVGIKCEIDNKIVFECEIEGKKIFYGFYDFTFSVGFGVRSQY